MPRFRPSPTHSAYGMGLALFAGSVCLLCIHAWQYYPFIADDALITLRYAERLLQGDGLTWSDGRPVEGYSNLLWLLLAALLGWLGMDLILAVRLLGLLCMAAVLYALSRGRLSGTMDEAGAGVTRWLPRWLPGMAALLFFAAAAPVAVWSIGGLEQPLYAALLALAIPLMARAIEEESPPASALLGLSLLLGGMALTRPDGPLFTLAALLSVYAGRRFSGQPALGLRDAALLLALPVLCHGGQTGFRLWYYGEWVANTALVRIAPSLHHFQEGLAYLAGGMASLAPLSYLAALSALLLAAVRPALGVPLLVTGCLWAAYVAFIGGDVFLNYRHLVPLLALLAFALAGGIHWLMQKLARPWRALAPALLAILFAPYLYAQAKDALHKDEPGRYSPYRWVWNGRLTALLLKQAFHEQQPLMAVSAAGGMAYWSQLPALDVLGLNDYQIPRNRPADFGQGPVGHELSDADYVLARKPDLVVWHTGRQSAHQRASRELMAQSEFRRLYTLVQVLARDPDDSQRSFNAEVWMRKYDSKIGVQVAEGEIRVPGYLLNGNPATRAYIGQAGKLVAPVSATQPASVHLDAPAHAAHWEAEVVASARTDAAAVRVSRQGNSLLLELTTPTDTAIEVQEVILRPPPDP